MQNRIHNEQNLDRVVRVSDSYQMKVYDRVVLVSNLVGDDVITLPPVQEAAGNIYTIRTVDATGDGVDVIAKGDQLHAQTEGSTTINLGAAVAIDAANDFLVVYSDGLAWYVLAFNIA
jgi:hypothetical protein